MKAGDGKSDIAPYPVLRTRSLIMDSMAIRALLPPSRAATLALALASLLVSPSFAGWREDMKTFRIGMIAQDGAGQAVPGLSILKRAYSQALGIPVEIFVARDFASLIDAQVTSRVDYATYSTAAFATASLLCSCVEPVVAPVAEDGTAGIVAILVTRDRKLPSLALMGEYRVAIAPPDSVAGAVMPQFELAAKGTLLAGAAPHLVRAESASAAETMLVDGSVDAVFGWAPALAEGSAVISGGTLDRLAAAGIDRATLSVVWTSRPLKYGPHALRSGLDADVRRTLLAFLTSLKAQQPDVYDLLETIHGGGFVEVIAGDYAPAIEIVRQIGDGTQP